MPRPTIRITRVNLSQLVKNDPESAEHLESLFTMTDGNRQIAVERTRIAQEATAEAQIATATAAMSDIKLLRFAGNLSNLVATEQTWLPAYRNKDGEIVIESPFTMRDQRNYARAVNNQLTRAAGDDGDEPDIFEEDGTGR